MCHEGDNYTHIRNCGKEYCDVKANKTAKQCVEPPIDKCNADAKDCTYKLCHEGDNYTTGKYCNKTYCDAEAHKKEKQCAEHLIDKCDKDASQCTW